jgi:hypothetical protein
MAELEKVDFAGLLDEAMASMTTTLKSIYPEGTKI